MYDYAAIRHLPAMRLCASISQPRRAASAAPFLSSHPPLSIVSPSQLVLAYCHCHCHCHTRAIEQCGLS